MRKPKKKKVRVVVHDEPASYNIRGSFDSVIGFFKEMKEKANGLEDTYIDIETRAEYGGYEQAYLTIEGLRLETDEEYNRRIEKEKERNRAAKEKRQQDYLKLKKEFGE